jgi:redox-sensing transcriptional repressor
LTRQRKACVVGLGRLGQALLEYERFGAAGFVVVAGFDASINRLETLHTSVRLHAAYDIAAVTRREAIEVGLVAVPAEAAQGTADALVAGGVREILNFAPVALRVQDASVQIRGVDILNELRVLSAQRFLTRDDAEEKRG